MNRLDHLRALCNERGVDGFLVSSSSNIFYLSGFNRFLVEHDGFLLVTKKNAYIITSPLYTNAVKKFTPDMQVLETTPNHWYSQIVKKIITKEKLQTIGFEEQDLRVAEYFDLQEEKVSLKSVSLRNLRVQKNKEEIRAIEKACALTDKTFNHIISFIKPGVSEMQLSLEMDRFVRQNNAEIGFPSIVAFGPHSAVPHHMTSDEKLTSNSFVLLDFGIRCDGYLSDMSRTVFFGKPTSEQIRLYETVRKSQENAVAYIEKQLSVIPARRFGEASPLGGEAGIQKKEMDPGSESGMTIPDIFTKDVDHVSRETIEKENFTPYPHALGHGVGLEVHEAPTLSLYSPEKLIENAVFTIEPGIYIPQLGGVRIEDDYVIENKKLRQLTNADKKLIVIAG